MKMYTCSVNNSGSKIASHSNLRVQAALQSAQNQTQGATSMVHVPSDLNADITVISAQFRSIQCGEGRYLQTTQVDLLVQQEVPRVCRI